jgi:hypothetical protein
MPAGTRRVVTLALETGSPVRIEALRIEPIRPPGSGTRPVPPLAASAAELERWFGPRQTLESGRSVAFELDAALAAGPGPWRIEILGTDAQGHPVTVRADVTH